MSAVLVLADRESLLDLARFAARARALDADGAIRLQAVGGVLAAWVGVLPGHGLMGDGTVLGLRTVALAEPLELDTVVPVGSIGDRVARVTSAELPVPPTTLSPQWAALSPPRSGWEPAGQVPTDVLARAARAGIEEIAQGAPTGAGALAVADLRAQVWGRALEEAPAASAGAGFAAYALGLLDPDGTATLARSGRWTRLTTRGGFVLSR